MKVILLEDIRGTGKKYDIKEVADGYARNFLLPKKLVEMATSSALTKLVREKALFEERGKARIAELQEKVKGLGGVHLAFKVKVGKKKEVFGSVTDQDIEKALKERGIRNTKAEITRPLKELGPHKVTVNLGEGVKGEVKVTLEKEEGLLSAAPSHYLDDLNKFL